MSEPNYISPLLDGFTLGASISEHNGVVCYPAIKENSNKKYIVKIISIPASQAQFDALMLAGAYKDPGDAMEYFRGNGEDILKEAELLKTLSKIEGFLPYDGWQMEPITRRRLGYEIYLVGSYKRSLEKYIRKNAFTHLEAVNLGLDLCAALSVCRQAGFLYADLKPSNIYVSEKKEYRIGDLGFLSLDALRYASLPERYFSAFTPPELLDPMAPMNLTVDTFAVGMILYQLYNDGTLPFTGTAPLDTLPSPCHADYEMAEIIMKAVHPDPQQRWQDPKDLGKALAAYMQRNGVNDIPITPFIPLDVKPEDIVVIASPKKRVDNSEAKPEETAPEETAEEYPIDESETIPCKEESETEEPPAEATEPTEEIVAAEVAVTEDAEDAHDPDVAEIPPELETIPAADSTEIQTQEEENPLVEISEEVSKILSRADDLIAHEIPEETAFPAEPEQPDPFTFVKEDLEDSEENIPIDSPIEEEPPEDLPVKKKKTKHFGKSSWKNTFKKFISGCFVLLLLCGLCIGGFWYYQNVYLQTIDALSISGTQDQITVLVDTAVDESMLTVHCTDGNGKRYSESLHGGKVSFSDLQPSTQYTIQVDISGFRKLVGKTSDVFTTSATTQILSFDTIAGTEDGSVMLSFTVDGKEPDFWNIHYSAEGEEEKLETVTSHSAMITGLSVGKLYTFTLSGDKNFDLGGETSIQYLASRLILAEDLTVSSSNGNDITLRWNTPGDVVVENWSVRLYDGYGFEEQKTVTENEVLFTAIDPATRYTAEVTAAGMTQPSRINISADPIQLTEFQVDESEQTEMKITWKYTGNDPEDGWLLIYTVDGSGSQVVQCKKSSAEISPLIPGANYVFTLQAADSRTVFNNTITYKTTEAEPFSEHAFVLENVSIDLVKTPEETEWRYETLPADSFTSTFCVGDSASMVLQSSSSFYLPGNKTAVLFVFRDSYGNVLPELVSMDSLTWKSIWTGGDSKIGELDIPALPDSPGSYGMELYFNGGFVAKLDITITE